MVKSDIEIAREAKMRPILEVGAITEFRVFARPLWPLQG